MATTYRGYDIKQNKDGSYGVHSMGSHPVITETFPSEEAAMDHIDTLRRMAMQAKQS
jgi:hypothetical protein